ncbi:MAG: replicative DNA helicase [Bacilli bacterium]|nr:replicative DNA helicase [Bacilli bacterium]
MNNKVMPNDINAEQCVLGSMFFSKKALQKCIESLNKDLFYLDSHAKIFEAIKDLAESGKPIDITIVTSELNNRKQLTSVGGVEYLSELTTIVPSAANVEEYIRIVEEKAIRRRLIETAISIETDGYNWQDSLNELLDKSEKNMMSLSKSRTGSEFRPIQEVLFKTQANLEKLSQTKGEITGIPTGFYDIDKITSGLHESQLIIIAARPAMGKTAFALNLVTNVAMNTKKKVALFNLEMGAEQLAMRMLSSTGQINGGNLLRGKLEHNDWKRVNEAISRLAETSIFIDDTPGITIGEIRAKARRLASEEDLAMIVIDYLQLISIDSKYAGNRQQEISEISRSLKTLAMELKIPIIALAQLSRSVDSRDDKRPILSDLRESGSIEQDADIVAFLYRDDYYNKESAIDENTSKSEFIIRKHRNGPTTTINLVFKRDTSTFVNFIDKEAPKE